MANKYDKMLDFTTNQEYKLNSQFIISYSVEWKHLTYLKIPDLGQDIKQWLANYDQVPNLSSCLFCITHKLRLCFTFLNGSRKSKEELYLGHENDTNFKFQRP